MSSMKITDHLIEIKQSQAKMGEQLDRLYTAVDGSETNPGLMQRVGSLEASRNKMWGAGAALVGIWGVVKAVFLFKH